jgi:hypothetical protein
MICEDSRTSEEEPLIDAMAALEIQRWRMRLREDFTWSASVTCQPQTSSSKS